MYSYYHPPYSQDLLGDPRFRVTALPLPDPLDAKDVRGQVEKMKMNDFEELLASVKDAAWRGHAIDVVDTLEIAWKKAVQLWGTNAKPEHALSIMHAILARAARAEDGFGS